MIANGGPNGITKSSTFKPWASKVLFFEIFMDFGKLLVLMFFRSAKRRVTNQLLGDRMGPKC